MQAKSSRNSKHKMAFSEKEKVDEKNKVFFLFRGSVLVNCF